MLNPRGLRLLRSLALATLFTMPASLAAQAQADKSADKIQADKAKPETPNPSADKVPTPTPPAATTPAPSTPAPSTPAIKAPSSATPPAGSPPPVTPGSKEVPAPDTPGGKESPAPATKPPPAGTPDTATPQGKPDNTEIERGSPGIPDNATTESVNVQAHAAAMLPGQSSYDDAFKSIKASLEKLKAAIEKAGLKPSGHAITIFSEPDDKGFKYKLAIPLAAKPDGKVDLGKDITITETPAGKAIKFQHRGAYEDIDSTYDVITAYLDAKGLQVDNPYIEEYLTDLTTPDDPNLQVDIYVFVK